MTNFGKSKISLSMLSITLKLANILMINVYGLINLYLKVEPWVLSATPKLLSLIAQSAIMISEIHQNNSLLYVL